MLPISHKVFFVVANFFHDVIEKVKTADLSGSFSSVEKQKTWDGNIPKETTENAHIKILCTYRRQISFVKQQNFLPIKVGLWFRRSLCSWEKVLHGSRAHMAWITLALRGRILFRFFSHIELMFDHISLVYISVTNALTLSDYIDPNFTIINYSYSSPYSKTIWFTIWF